MLADLALSMTRVSVPVSISDSKQVTVFILCNLDMPLVINALQSTVSSIVKFSFMKRARDDHL